MIELTAKKADSSSVQLKSTTCLGLLLHAYPSVICYNYQTSPLPSHFLTASTSFPAEGIMLPDLAQAQSNLYQRKFSPQADEKPQENHVNTMLTYTKDLQRGSNFQSPPHALFLSLLSKVSCHFSNYWQVHRVITRISELYTEGESEVHALQ